MTTKFVGVKEFRQNIAKFAKSALKNKQRLVILNRNTPIFEVWPIDGKKFTLEKLLENPELGKRNFK